MSISSHTIVCNEERYIWYSIMSMASYMDKIFIWDTGSTDSTIDIIKEIKRILGDKVDFQEFGKVDPEGLVKLRQKMLHETKTDWFVVLDGDEVWWEGGIRKLTKMVKRGGEKLDSVVVPYYNLIGDIYHYLPESRGKYKIDGRVGHINIRATRRGIAGLKLSGVYPTEAYVDENGVSLQDMSKKGRQFLDFKFLHFTHLVRSSSISKDKEALKRASKFKYELGKEFPLDFYYPEVFLDQNQKLLHLPGLKRVLIFI